MSWRGKRKDEKDRGSDANSDDHQRPNKFSKFSNSDDSDSIVVCEISKNRRVSVRNWQGKTWIDIREFYVKDGKQLPGKKDGACTLIEHCPGECPTNHQSRYFSEFGPVEGASESC